MIGVRRVARRVAAVFPLLLLTLFGSTVCADPAGVELRVLSAIVDVPTAVTQAIRDEIGGQICRVKGITVIESAPGLPAAPSADLIVTCILTNLEVLKGMVTEVIDQTTGRERDLMAWRTYKIKRYWRFIVKSRILVTMTTPGNGAVVSSETRRKESFFILMISEEQSNFRPLIQAGSFVIEPIPLSEQPTILAPSVRANCKKFNIKKLIGKGLKPAST